MYLYQKAFAKRNKSGSRWKEVDLQDVSLKSIFDTYKAVYVILTNTAFEGEVGFDLIHIRSKYFFSDTTLRQFLIITDNAALPHMAKLPKLSPKYVRYADGVHAGYKINPIHPTASVDSQLPNSEKTYLHLTRDETDYELFFKHCLVTVNGFFHLTDYDTNGIYVVDGNKSARINNNNQLGIYSFREVGELTQIPITDDMITRQLENIPLSTKTYIKLPEKLGNKIPILIMAGYMHFLDERTCYPIDESTLCVNFLNYPFLDRFYEAKDYLDYSTLPWTKYARNDTQISREDIESDEMIRAVLTMPQSFIVLLDAQDVFVEKLPVEVRSGPGMLISHVKPIYPMVGGRGHMLDYWYTHEDGQYALNVVKDWVDRRLYQTTQPENLLSYTDHRIPTDRMAKSFAYFLQIGVDLVTT